jgi:AraC-like DNA-binding protein
MPAAAFVHEAYRPRPELREYVECYSVFRAALPDEDLSVSPTGARSGDFVGTRTILSGNDPLVEATTAGAQVALMFSVDGPLRMTFGMSGRRSETTACIFGPAIEWGRMEVGPHTHVFGVTLRPGAAGAFLRMPVNELTDRVHPLAEFWGPRGTALESGVRSAASVQERIRRVEEDLLRRLPFAEAVDPRMHQILGEVARHRGAVSMTRLSHAAGISRQHLARRFQQAVGVGPKLYCRLKRFESVMAEAYSHPKVDWAELAADLGYADQSHLIGEFKEFAGRPPGEFFANR